MLSFVSVSVRSQVICLYFTPSCRFFFSLPFLLQRKPLRITFGFSTKTPLKEDYGVMFYNRNRLIKAYEKLGYQKQVCIAAD